MHPAALLLALSLSAHAVPVLNSRGNDTYERRDAPYKVVNVAGPSTPVFETITATNPPATITVTEYPSSTAAVLPGPSYSPWTVGPAVSDALERRETNSTKRAFRRFGTSISDATTNSTESHAIAARSNETAPDMGEHIEMPDRRSDSRNETEHGLHARSNSTSEVFARGNDTISKVMARHDASDTVNSTSEVFARGNDTISKLMARQPALHESEAANSTSGVVARSNDTLSKIPAEGVDIAQRDLNTSNVISHPGRDLNGTDLQTREINATHVDATAGTIAKRALNTTDVSSKVYARSSNDTVLQSRQIADAVVDAASDSKHENATKLALEQPKARALNETEKAPIMRMARSPNDTTLQSRQITDAVVDDAASDFKHENATKLATKPMARALNETEKASAPRMARSSNETASQA
ncbi:hypothetical protein BO78DRAFT_397756 [Aspergillus sclerotiicarbonarius CBS 121057]|uniref:Uncharacterized protein n=1 Tax=Aspergillus sclerotiicarbonarius (strain CBS 121057 / IBT 28362) TaxID=1448318 RepID=A0A319EQH9_ASPSB|nr:hypothetical protein BO78DRAFT_397756 [Aspergillus sclerotiicarbonarius CBS 121057]